MVFFILTDGIYSIMQDPKQQEIFKKFKEGIFPYVIKSDVLKGRPYIKDIEVLDEFHVNNHTGKIYPLFVAKLNMDRLYDMHPYMVDTRRLQETIVRVIQEGLDKFFPTNDFNLLAANVTLEKVYSS